jgi:hydroxymethylpyrimidine pyrophosphatase-like HAD family hydrolase
MLHTAVAPEYILKFNDLLASKAPKESQRISIPKPERAHVFDIDGVLTDPVREVVPFALIEKITTLLEKGDKVSFNTGRPVSWAIDKLLTPLLQNLRDSSLLDNCVLCGEKGAVSVHVANNRAVIETDPSLSVSRNIAASIRKYAESNQYLKYFSEAQKEKFKGMLVYDEAKLAMATIYVTDQVGNEFSRIEFIDCLKDRKISAAILADLQQICGEKFTIDQTQIAFDLQHQLSGKDLGARKIIALQELDAAEFRNVYTYGDSGSDVDMAKELASQGFQVEHIHVGKVAVESNVPGVSIYNTVSHLKVCHSLAALNAITDRIEHGHGFKLIAEPEFLAGPVTINCFTDQIEGLPATRRSFVDFQSLKQLLTESQLNAFKLAMKDELKFSGKPELDLTRQGFNDWLEKGDQSNPLSGARFGEAYSKASDKFLDNMMGKVGIRNLRKNAEGQVIFDVVRVPFQAYKLFSRPGISPAMRDFCAVTGVAMIPVSRDGKIIMQLRSASNGAWARVPGAGIAGMFDAERDPKNPIPGAPKKINNKTMYDRLHTEGKEEIGLEPNQIINVEITGIADDGAKPHNEITAIGYTFLTAEEHLDAARANHKKTKEGDFHFSETAFVIPGTSDGVKDFFLNVLCPLPSTHAAALIAAGYDFCLSEGRSEGQAKAEEWKAEMQEIVSSYYQRIDQEVVNYYQQEPANFFEVPARFNNKLVGFLATVTDQQLTNIDFTGMESYQDMLEKLPVGQKQEALKIVLAVRNGILPQRHLTGFSPDYWPEDQGLPLMEDALKVAGYL